MKKSVLEVIVNSEKDIITINESLADQIEFCIDLDNGGLTPAIEDLKLLVQNCNKKIRVMLRHHYDNFYITKEQLDKIINFMKNTNHFNIDGYVFGAITKNHTIDHKSLNQVLKHLNNKSLTFHKAFDYIKNKEEALEELMTYKDIKYILTSGGEGNPLENLDFFNKVKPDFKKRILIGGGVNMNVIKTLKLKGYKNFHIGKVSREENNYISKLSINNINMYKKAI